MKTNLQPAFTELVESYNRLVDEINEITLKSLQNEFDKSQMAVLKVRMETIATQLNAIRLTLKNLRLYAQTEIRPDGALKDLSRISVAQHN